MKISINEHMYSLKSEEYRVQYCSKFRSNVYFFICINEIYTDDEYKFGWHRVL